MSAESIVSNYINSIGGRDRLEEVQSIEVTGNANLNMQGQSFVLEFYSLKNNQNQSLATVTAGGMMVQKSVFNKYQGYNEVNGQRIPLTDSELESAIIDSALFSELNYDFSTIELVGTSVVNDEKVYEIKVTDSKTEYYSIESGLKIKEVETTEIEGNQIVVETTVNDYEEIDGVLIPSEINQVTPALPIPGGINDSNNADWKSGEMNAGQMAMARMALGGIVKGFGGLAEEAVNTIDAIQTNKEEVKNAVRLKSS